MRRDGGSVFPVRANTGGPVGPVEAWTLMRSHARERAGSEAKFGLKAHPHMLRHACGYALANKGHDTRALQAYLGHRNFQHAVRYTELSPTRFKDFWR